ncbi:LamG-like jellyroll fold domain-containing protein [Nonomuraea sp. NPDC050404]|uniref:LamG-like jellyroll fold domain-containing protein n=1 Tax=Nonomuraea sp. NPDC050404 TaxID=3155783 RepID=UPI0033EA117B
MAVRYDAASEQHTATNGLPGNVYTLTAWIWPAAVGSRFRTIYWLRTFADQFSGVTIRDSTSELQLIDSGSHAFNGVAPLVATAATWYRIGVVVSGADATFYRAAAGDPLGSGSVADFSPPAAPQQWTIGDDPYDDWWDGRLAALKVWDAALSAVEVEDELAQHVPRRTSNLLRFHPFLNAELTDYSGNNNALSGGTGTTTESGPPIPWASAIPTIIIPPAVPSGVDAAGASAIAVSSSAIARKVVAISARSCLAVAGAGAARKVAPVASVTMAVARASAAATHVGVVSGQAGAVLAGRAQVTHIGAATGHGLLALSAAASPRKLVGAQGLALAVVTASHRTPEAAPRPGSMGLRVKRGPEMVGGLRRTASMRGGRS